MGAFENKAWLQHYAEWTDRQLPYGDDTLVSRFNDAVAKHRNKKFTWFMGKELTYGEVEDQVRRVATGLSGLGVKQGDRVAIALPNCPQHVVSILAVHSLSLIHISEPTRRS